MKVKAKHHFKHNNKDVQKGDVLDVPDHVGNTLIQGGHAEKHEDDPAQKQEIDPSSSGGKQ